MIIVFIGLKILFVVVTFFFTGFLVELPAFLAPAVFVDADLDEEALLVAEAFEAAPVFLAGDLLEVALLDLVPDVLLEDADFFGAALLELVAFLAAVLEEEADLLGLDLLAVLLFVAVDLPTLFLLAVEADLELVAFLAGDLLDIFVPEDFFATVLLLVDLELVLFAEDLPAADLVLEEVALLAELGFLAAVDEVALRAGLGLLAPVDEETLLDELALLAPVDEEALLLELGLLAPVDEEALLAELGFFAAVDEAAFFVDEVDFLAEEDFEALVELFAPVAVLFFVATDFDPVLVLDDLPDELLSESS